jgi:L-rhamnose mutarotase
MSEATGDVQRIASVTRIKPEKLEEYRRLHADPWPGVLDQLRVCNISNYSIFLHEDLLFSYFEYTGTDFDADMARMAADPTTRQWWKLTDPCQDPLPGTPENRQWTEIPSIFFMK